jgi:serine/threonine protein kinase
MKHHRSTSLSQVDIGLYAQLSQAKTIVEAWQTLSISTLAMLHSVNWRLYLSHTVLHEVMISQYPLDANVAPRFWWIDLTIQSVVSNQAHYIAILSFRNILLIIRNRDQSLVALKIVKSAGHYTETAMDEIKLLEKIVNAKPKHSGKRHIVQLLNNFMHAGPNGIHVCMVFEVLGENLLTVIRRHQHRGIPVNTVKRIARQMLEGLEYMHGHCAIIHTDLKPENVLVCVEKEEEDNNIDVSPRNRTPNDSEPKVAEKTKAPPPLTTNPSIATLGSSEFR